MAHCKSLKLLSDLPPYLRYLNAHGCTSLEKVSFTYQNPHLYELHSFNGKGEFFMIFSNCFNLSPDSVNNIEANAVVKLATLAENWARKYAYGPKQLFCCFPGNEISNRFEYRNMDSSLSLKIPPNRCGGRRFFALAICLVADLKHCHPFGMLECICEYQLKTTSGEYKKFKSEWCWNSPKPKPKYKSQSSISATTVGATLSVERLSGITRHVMESMRGLVEEMVQLEYAKPESK
ncbi:hypothetical protein V6N13_038462 [Hibiscus sabdariffa]